MQFVNTEDHKAVLEEGVVFRDEDGILWKWNGEDWRIVPDSFPENRPEKQP